MPGGHLLQFDIPDAGDGVGTVVRLEEGLSGLEYRLESVNAMLAAIRASAGTAWHC